MNNVSSLFFIPSSHTQRIGTSRFNKLAFSVTSSPASSMSLYSNSNDNDTKSQNNPQISQQEEQKQKQKPDFHKYFNFPLDDWQSDAGIEIYKGHNVITCAPTGAGKTVVGEIALHYAFNNGKNAIYTTPLKALSNQKFAELRKIFGSENVGLSTGDMSINRDARIVVMTTEVYRNMAWRASSSTSSTSSSYEDYDDEYADNDDELANLSIVVLDEFHYMGQPGRGGVWEECVITSPPHTQIIGLSATLPNANDISSWMTDITNKNSVLIEALGGRPVPLSYMFGTRDGLQYLFRDSEAGPGAKLGLLGLRGDGIASSSSSSSSKSNGKDTTYKIPKGLGLNPKLKSMIQRRAEKINRIIARTALKSEFKKDYNIDYDKRRNKNNNTKLNPKAERKQRERLLKSEMRKAVPSIQYTLRQLDQKQLLPAIFFIFSRAGCDNAAEQVCFDMRKKSEAMTIMSMRDEAESEYEIEDGEVVQNKKGKSRRRGNTDRRSRSTMQDNNGRKFRSNSNYVSEDTMSSILDGNSNDFMSKEDYLETLNPLNSETGSIKDINLQEYADRGLLTIQAVKDVAARVTVFNNQNEEIKFDNNVIDQFLHGVGSHHAGQLPAHKAFVEALFRSQLMKVVFATETLAAGINMPARTTVICSMAKRGEGSSMNLLETSNMLQMAGRAGRRGMDTDGTCVLVATPFEGPDQAIDILTSEIKPITSQFSPSYSLAVNLIARGEGKLDVARKLVQKSFAMWGKQRVEDKLEFAKQAHGDQFEEVMEIAAHVKYLDRLKELLDAKYNGGGAISNSKVKKVLEVLDDKNLLKKASKTLVGLNQILELEQNTLNYLKQEANPIRAIDHDIEIYGLRELMNVDNADLENEFEEQQKRIEKISADMSNHVMTAMAVFANDFLNNPQSEYDDFRASLQLARGNDQDLISTVNPIELCRYAKNAVISNRKRRKQSNLSIEEGIDESSLIAQLSSVETVDDSWEDMLAILNVLQSYGCITASSHDSGDKSAPESFKITTAGEDVAMLGLDNSLWVLVAMGGAWDVKGDSSKLDEFKTAMRDFDIFDDEHANDISQESENSIPLPQSEAATLISLLRSLEPSEIAGYVSCLIADGFRGGNGSALTYFQNLSSTQQRVIQNSLASLERLVEVQNKFSVDETCSKVQLELGTCEVVTAWASGCSWNEALEISGLAPGDLVRTLHRALDALRQIGNLKYNAARSIGDDVKHDEAPGIHPDIRRLCTEAARAMNRYPVKDPLPFDEEEEDTDEEEEEGIDEEEEDIDEEEDAKQEGILDS